MGDERIDVQWSLDVGRAGWISERLAPFGQDTITSVIPSGFEAYARLLHPVETDPSGIRPVIRWADVARWSGAPLTRDAQSHDIALPSDTPEGPAPGAGSHPAEGTMCGDDAAALVDLLRAPPGGGRCWFALWDGYGWGFGHGAHDRRGTSGTVRLRDPIPAEVHRGVALLPPVRGCSLAAARRRPPGTTDP